MNNDNIEIYVKKIIIQCLNEIGITINMSMLQDDDINLIEYNLDSLTFISFLSDLEERLNITIPDEYLDFTILQSLNGFANLLSQIVTDSHENIL